MLRDALSGCNGILGILVVVLAILVVVQPAMAQTRLYVAPIAMGDGSGSSVENADRYDNAGLWNRVRQLLAESPVTVTFLEGEYTGALTVMNMGHPEHRLTLESQSPGGAIFSGTGWLRLAGVSNATVRGFGFTGGGSQKLQIIDTLIGTGTGPQSRRGTLSHHILVEGNSFYDAPTVYGGLSIRNGSHHITVYNNTFRRVGQGSGAHMLYNFADVHHIKVIGNHFEDSTGDYIRFRHNADFGEVRMNTFVSTDQKYNLIFVRMTAINDVDPGDEYHASNFLIRDNHFSYFSPSGTGVQDAMGYTSGGYNPPGLHYLPTAEGGAILTRGTPDQKRKLMLDTMNIDLSRVRVYANTYENVRYPFRYWASVNYGATSQGWTGLADISDAVNSIYIGQGDVYSDGVLDEKDVELFLLALDAGDEMRFLLDERVWFGDWHAADMNGDGEVDHQDVQQFLERFDGLTPEETLEPLRSLVR